MRPKAAVQRLRSMREALIPAVMEAERQNLKDALAIAEQLSSGEFSTAQLRRLGHPYATRNPRPPADPAIINVQRGVFRRGWRIRGPRQLGGKIAGRLENISDVAKYMHGTSKMIPRPIWRAIMQKISPIRRRRLVHAVKQVLASRNVR